MRLLLAILFLSLLAVEAHGRDIFVDNRSGDDTLTGRSAGGEGTGNGPVQTIAKAARLATPGDRIVLANTGEPYREQVTLQGGKCSGLGPDSPFVLEGNGAVIDGTVDVPDEAWQIVGRSIFRFGPLLKSHQTLFIDNAPVARAPVRRGEPLPRLEPLQWALVDGWVYLRTEAGAVPQQYHAICAGLQTGITLYDVRDVVVRNVVVRGFALDGINAHDDAFNVLLESVVSSDNGRSGISVGGASHVRIVGCQAAGNHEAQLRSEGYSHVRYSECKFDEAFAPAIEQAGGEITAE
jgi:parallel beta helix pectate lyase-like protein